MNLCSQAQRAHYIHGLFNWYPDCSRMLDLGWGRFAIVGIAHRTHRVKEVEQRLRAGPKHKKGSLWTVNRPMQQDLLLGYRRRLSTMQCRGKPISSPECPSGRLHQDLSVWILGQLLQTSEAFLTLPCANEPSESHSSQRLAQVNAGIPKQEQPLDARKEQKPPGKLSVAESQEPAKFSKGAKFSP